MNLTWVFKWIFLLRPEPLKIHLLLRLIASAWYKQVKFITNPKKGALMAPRPFMKSENEVKLFIQFKASHQQNRQA